MVGIPPVADAEDLDSVGAVIDGAANSVFPAMGSSRNFTQARGGGLAGVG